MKKVQGQEPMYSSATDCFRKIIKQQGVLGLYRGATAPLAGVIPINAIYFWGYDVAKYQIRKFRARENQFPDFIDGGISGICATIPGSILVSPMERIKCIIQTVSHAQAHSPPFNNTLNCGMYLLRTGGIRSLYRGLEWTFIRDIPGNFVYFGVYESIKAAITTQQNSGSKINPAAISLAGGAAGLSYWILCLPLDVIKNRYQSASDGVYSSPYDAAIKTWKDGGMRGLYRGIGPALLRAFPANVATFLGFEVSKSVLTSLFMDR